MDSIYKDKYVEIFIGIDRSLIFDVWQEDSINMEEEDFKEIMYVWRDTILRHQICLALTDTRNMNYPVTPDLQDWISGEITNPVYKKGFEKQAFVMPQAFIQKLVIEQVVDEASIVSKNIESSRYFTTIEEAEEWLLS